MYAVFFWINFAGFIGTEAFCQSMNGLLVCCAGFYWNTYENQCMKCPIGYQGRQCSNKCSFPTYGEDCQMLCRCKRPECDPVGGCQDVTETTQRTIIQQTNTISMTLKLKISTGNRLTLKPQEKPDGLQNKLENWQWWIATTIPIFVILFTIAILCAIKKKQKIAERSRVKNYQGMQSIGEYDRLRSETSPTEVIEVRNETPGQDYIDHYNLMDELQSSIAENDVTSKKNIHIFDIKNENVQSREEKFTNPEIQVSKDRIFIPLSDYLEPLASNQSPVVLNAEELIQTAIEPEDENRNIDTYSECSLDLK